MNSVEIIKESHLSRKHLFNHLDLSEYKGEGIVYAQYILGTLPLSDIKITQSNLDDWVLQALSVRHLYNDDISLEDYCEYVVQPKVNNESIDPCRKYFAKIVKDLVVVESMHKTVVNINTWIIEVVQYRSTDARTKNASFTYKSGTGRCGEKSTLMVQVCRSVGIPTRQVYAPWWSHTDDRHAWVEVLIDGTWKFLGAGDSDPQLNQAWFKEAASRALVIQCNHFSHLKTDEAILDDSFGQFKRLNITKRYAPTRKMEILNLLDVDVLSFEIVNYGSFKNLFKRKVKLNQTIEVEIGLGTFFIKARKNDDYYFKQVNEEDIIVTISERDLIRGKTKIIQKAAEALNEKTERSQEELNKIAAIKSKQMKKYEQRMANIDRNGINRFEHYQLEESLGKENSESILRYLSDKDKQDFKADTLIDHYHALSEYKNKYNQEIYERYVLCPRIYYEDINKHASSLKEMDLNVSTRKFKDVYVPDTIMPFDLMIQFGPYSELEKDVLTVAILRRKGVASYYDPDYGRVMTYLNNDFVPLDQNLKKVEIEIEKPRKAVVTVRNLDSSDAMASKTLQSGVYELFTGTYEFMVSQRLANGTLVASFEIVKIKENRNINLDLPAVDHSVFLENINIEDLLDVHQLENTGIIILAKIQEEPSQHTINELMDNAMDCELTIFDENVQHSLYKKLVSRKKCRIINFDRDWADKVSKRLFKDINTLPIVIFYKDGRSIFSRQGYEVGLMHEEWIYEYMEEKR